MLKHIIAAVAAFPFVVVSAGATGLVHNDNFIIFTPTEPTHGTDQAFAEQLLARAEEFRRELAVEWLGSPLPPGAGRTILSVKLTENEASGLTWAKDNPRRGFQNIFLTTTRTGALGGTLKHEMTHVVLATRFPHPNSLPVWVEEGIASRYDDDANTVARQQILNRFASADEWPDLRRLLDSHQIKSNDGTTYAAAASLIDYLLSRSDKNTLFNFAFAGKKQGWDSALRQCYNIQNVEELAVAWHAWVKDSNKVSFAAP